MDDRRSSETGTLTAERPEQVGGLEINPAEDGYIIYQPDQDRVHYLNPTAVFILELCNGKNSVEEIVDAVKEAYGLPDRPVKVVQEALDKLKSENLLLQV
jgi:hypothetical protein